MSEVGRELVKVEAGALAGRRRSAPSVERTSDVTRTRGWLAGSLAGGLGLIAALVVELSSGATIGPGRAIARPHREAGLDCASCHGEGRPGLASAEHDPAAACVGCHADQRSTRRPHARLLAEGRMRCTTCHATHRAEGGVTFVPGQPAVRWRNGGERELDGLEIPAWTGREASTVALVELAACETCHDPSRPDDPMAHCVLRGHDDPEDPVVCFDEHTPLLVAAGSERAALWELAREAAAVGAPEPKTARGGGTRLPLWLGLSLGSAGLGLAGARLWGRRRDRVELERGRADPGADATPEAGAMLRPAERRRLPTIDASTCIGCNACVDACPYDVLDMQAYVAVVARPDDCCGLSLCEQRCPNGSLIVTEGERLPDLPRIDDALEARDAPGVHLAGDVTGLPLIRNAINQGAHAVGAVAERLDALALGPGPALDLIIVGAGPAGIAAALEAKRRKLRYLVLEQASAAESIRSFPRGKLVFDQPLGMPMVGELWLRESSKEELLGKWLRIIRSEGLEIRERTRVLGCERVAGGPPRGHLRVRARGPEGEAVELDCARVLLAFGRRGSPRKLDVDLPEAMLDHVHYSLADARSFAGRSVLVVGLGDVAMEAAIGLAQQPGARVAVSYRGADFKRGKRRNVEELRRLIAAGRVEMLWSTQVEAVEPGRVRLRQIEGGEEIDSEVDSLFVMIGNVAPTALLTAFGVEQG